MLNSFCCLVSKNSRGLDFISSDFLHQYAVRAFLRSRVAIFRYFFFSSKFSGVRSFANWMAYFLLFLFPLEDLLLSRDLILRSQNFCRAREGKHGSLFVEHVDNYFYNQT